MRPQILLALLSSLLPLATAQQVADGLLVPFTTTLPACASLCAKLFDVQGACVPPVTGEISSSCFCSDPRLKPFANDGTAGVSSVCTAASCTAAADLEKIQDWYETFCNLKVADPTPTTGGGSTPTGTTSTTSKPKKVVVNQTWIEGHWKWVIMLVVLVVAIAGGWVGAIFLRRRYIRNKEKAFEMRPPVAWGPHQMQGATNGYNYGDGAENSPGGHSKEGAAAIPATKKRESKGWLRKERT